MHLFLVDVFKKKIECYTDKWRNTCVKKPLQSRDQKWKCRNDNRWIIKVFHSLVLFFFTLLLLLLLLFLASSKKSVLFKANIKVKFASHTNYLFYSEPPVHSIVVCTRNRLQLMASLNLIYVRNMFIMCLKINISLVDAAGSSSSSNNNKYIMSNDGSRDGDSDSGDGVANHSISICIQFAHCSQPIIVDVVLSIYFKYACLFICRKTKCAIVF